MTEHWDAEMLDLPEGRAVEPTRLINLYISLTHGRRMTLEQVRTTFAEHDDYQGSPEASRKAFRRDCDKLRGLGLDVQEKDDQYWIVPHTLRPAAALSPVERATVTLAVATMLPVFSGEARSLLVAAAWKLGLLNDLATPDPGLAARIDARVLAVIDAVRIGRPLRFDYENARGERSTRTVHPWMCVEYDHRWLFRGFDERSGDTRTFRADRIVKGTHGIERGGFRGPVTNDDKIVLEPWRWGDSDPVDAVVRITGDVSESRLPAGSTVNVEEGVDQGALLVEVPVNDLDAFATWVLRRSPHAVVAGPHELLQRLTTRLAEIAEQHEAPAPALPAEPTPPSRKKHGQRRGAGVRRAARLLHILGMTDNREVPLSSLAEALGITEDELYDDLVQIHYYTGLMPLYGDEFNEAWLNEGLVWTRAPAAPYVAQLSGREVAALELAAREMLATVQLSDVARTQLEDALKTLGLDDLPPDDDQSIEGPDPTRRTALLKAVSEARTVRFSYRKAGANAAEMRTVDPWRIVEAHGAVYLIARDHDRDARRWFRVDRLDDLKVTDEVFTPPPVEELPETFESFADEGTEPVVVIIPTDHASWARDRFGPETATLEEDRAILRIPSARPEQLVPTLLALAPGAETVSPPEVRAMVADAASALLDAHTP